MNDNENQIINDLYQQGNQEQPPKALDDLILKHAQQSQHTASNAVKGRQWRPWLAAASVVLVLPLIWLLTQNQQLHETTETMGQSIGNDTAPVKSEAPKNLNDAGTSAELPVMDEVEVEAEASPEISSYYEQPAAAPMLDSQEKIEAQSQRSISGKPIDKASLQANKAVLMDELKAKKRTIKPSTMDPLMALEYEQFGRYLEQGQIESADNLLTEMQENWPDFDFEEMIYRLAEAEIEN